MEKIDLAALKNAKSYSVEYPDYENIITKDFLKKFRKDNDLTQLRLACILNVSKKTIEKWEQGVNPIKGTSAVLIYLLSNNPELITELYKEERNY